MVEDTEKMNKSKVEICSKIFENQKKLASLDSDTSRLTQVKRIVSFDLINVISVCNVELKL